MCVYAHIRNFFVKGFLLLCQMHIYSSPMKAIKKNTPGICSMKYIDSLQTLHTVFYKFQIRQ